MDSVKFHFKSIAALIVLALAGGVWGIQLGRNIASNEESLRDTNGIIATVLSVQPVERGYSVGCRVENKRRKPAAQIVLCVTLLDSKDQMIAANPLVSTPHLAAGQTLELSIFIPADANISSPKGRVQVSLVRWAGE